MKVSLVGALLAGALLAGACSDPVAATRIDQLERDLVALRAAHHPSSLAPAIGDALAPLHDAIAALARRAEAERARFSAVTAEVGQLATLVHGFVDDTRRVQVDELRQRLQDLEAQAKAQASAQAEDNAILLRALELTATRLEAFLREVTPAPRPATQPGTQPTNDNPPAKDVVAERKSSLHPAWFALAGVVGGLLLALLLRRRAPVRRRRPDVIELPGAVVDAPAPMLASPLVVAPRAAATHGPLALRAVVPTSAADATATTLRRWHADDPRVLTAPAPRCDVRGRAVHVEFHVSSALPAAERAGLVAEVLLHDGALETQGERRTA